MNRRPMPMPAAARCARAGLVLAMSAVLSAAAHATPSSTFWTPMIVDLQPFRVPHLGIDNYFTVDRKASSGQQGAFPSDLGFTIGVLPGRRLQAELGFDALEPSDAPLLFNAKLGAPEGSLFRGAPAVQLGVFALGARRNATDQDVVYGVIGRSVPGIGRLTAGPYAGNARVLRDANGVRRNTGVMLAFDRGFATVRDAEGNEFSSWMLAADYASGRNAIGGGGVGVYRYFTRGISLLTGPVWFNEKAINGAWKWTTQLDINL